MIEPFNAIRYAQCWGYRKVCAVLGVPKGMRSVGGTERYMRKVVLGVPKGMRSVGGTERYA